jgi:hypothetical protein
MFLNFTFKFLYSGVDDRLGEAKGTYLTLQELFRKYLIHLLQGYQLEVIPSCRNLHL